MNKKIKILALIVLTTFAPIYTSFSQTKGNIDLKSEVNNARMHLIKAHNKKGTWSTFSNFDTIPESLKRDDNFFTGMLIADLLKPYNRNKKIDSLIKITLNYSYKNINPENGFLRFYNRFEDLPEDTDDTGLFWFLAQKVDTGMILKVIDSLQEYKIENGLYLEWLKNGGIGHMPQTGSNPETVGVIPNIHIFLFLSKYDTVKARDLCQCLKADKIVSNPDYWTYYFRAPWLYYLRQADMTQYNCPLDDNLPNEVKSLSSQQDYELMSKFIRDMSLGKRNQKMEKEIKLLLTKLSNNDFAYFKENPMLLHHSDLTSKSTVYFWSYDMPYALWLRLYYDLEGQRQKKK